MTSDTRIEAQKVGWTVTAILYLGLFSLALGLILLVSWLVMHLPTRPDNYPTLADLGTDEQVLFEACIFSENELRLSIEPQKVAFDSCAATNKFQQSISKTEVSISGAAMIEKNKKKFIATMKRSVPGGPFGFTLIGIEID